MILAGLKLVLLVLPWTVSGGKEETGALIYLSKYGYIPKNAGTEALVTEDNIKEFIKVIYCLNYLFDIKSLPTIFVTIN